MNDQYIIPGDKITNNPIPKNPRPIGRLLDRDLKSDESCDMFYYEQKPIKPTIQKK
jgi:hypothetical protein